MTNDESRTPSSTNRHSELDIRHSQSAGFVGQITSNSFMKREFGKKLIEEYLPRWDLTHVLDTAGAYIPGHGTPTVILLGKNQPPVSGTIRTVLGIRGEPARPTEPALGLVWQAIVNQIDQPGSVSGWMSAADSQRANFRRHPWSIGGGGGAAELKEEIEGAGEGTLNDNIASIGIGVVTLEDDAFSAPAGVHRRAGISQSLLLDFAEGDIVRDWVVNDATSAIFPYGRIQLRPATEVSVLRFLWPQRIGLLNRRWCRKTEDERGYLWWEYGFVSTEKLATPRSIAWGEVATHNHFVLDRGGKVFNRTAPVMKLKAEATEDDHLALLGLLNSSVACFWLRQVCFPKGGDHQGTEGARVRASLWDERFALNATQIAGFPVAKDQPLALSKALDSAAEELRRFAPSAVLADASRHTRSALNEARTCSEATLQRMISFQEELDWHCYRSYGLIEGDELLAVAGADGLPVVPPLRLGERTFEILLARSMADGGEQSTWFERHGTHPLTEPPGNWPESYRQLHLRRCRAVKENPDPALIERPEY